MQKYDPYDTEAVKSQMILREDTRFIGKYLQKGNLSVGASEPSSGDRSPGTPSPGKAPRPSSGLVSMTH